MLERIYYYGVGNLIRVRLLTAEAIERAALGGTAFGATTPGGTALGEGVASGGSAMGGATLGEATSGAQGAGGGAGGGGAGPVVAEQGRRRLLLGVLTGPVVMDLTPDVHALDNFEGARSF